MNGKARCTMSIEKNLIDQVDILVKDKIFASRSHAAERAIKELLEKTVIK